QTYPAWVGQFARLHLAQLLHGAGMSGGARQSRHRVRVLETYLSAPILTDCSDRKVRLKPDTTETSGSSRTPQSRSSGQRRAIIVSSPASPFSDTRPAYPAPSARR